VCKDCGELLSGLPRAAVSWVCAFCRGVVAQDYMFCTLCHLSRDRHRPGPKIRGKFQSAGIVVDWEALYDFPADGKTCFARPLTMDLLGEVLFPLLRERRLPPYRVDWGAAFAAFAAAVNVPQDPVGLAAYKRLGRDALARISVSSTDSKKSAREKICAEILALADAAFWATHRIRKDKVCEGHGAPHPAPPEGQSPKLAKLRWLETQGIVFKALGMKERRAGLVRAVREGAVTVESVDSNGVVVVPVPKRVRVEVVE
jgi:hypothetical protein